MYWTLQYRYPNIFTISFEEFIEQMRAPGNLSLSPRHHQHRLQLCKEPAGNSASCHHTVISSYYISLEYTAVYTYLRKWLKETRHSAFH